MSVPDVDATGLSLKKWVRNGVIVLLLVVGGFVAWRMTTARRVNHALAALKSQGYPTTMEELERMYYAPVSREENAATILNTASGMVNLKNQPRSNQGFIKLPRTGPLFANEEVEKFKLLAADNQAALAFVRTNTMPKTARFPIAFGLGFSLTLPHVTKIADLERLLLLDTAFNADAGRPEVALADIEAMFRVSKTIADEPFQISQLRRTNFRTMICSGVEILLNRGPLTEAQLARLSELFAADDRPGTVERVMAGEVCLGGWFFAMSPSQRAAVLGGAGMSPGISGTSINQNFRAATGLVDQDYRYYLKVMTEYLRIARLPYPERMEAARTLDEQVTSDTMKGLHYYSLTVLPALAGWTARYGEHAARLGIVQTVLAIERYRLAHGGELPGELKDLTPGLLAEVPKDPFDGKPLRYKKLAKGYVVYSIGRDGKDADGEENIKNKSGGPDDVTFTVER